MATKNFDDVKNIGPAAVDKLHEAGYHSWKSLATSDPESVDDKAGIGEKTSKRIVQAAREESDVGGFESGASRMEKRRAMEKVSTQIPALDELFGGTGLEPGSITEFYGEFGAGKSQVTHQMAVNVQLPKSVGGAEQGCLFIDTEDTFRPERIAGMVTGLDEDVLEAVIERERQDDRGFDYTVEDIKNSEREAKGVPVKGTPADELAERFLERIHVAEAFTSDHQVSLTQEKAFEVAEELSGSEWPIGLVVVDSLTAHFRAEYVGRGQLADRQQKLNKHLAGLKQLAKTYDCVVAVTNQVAANPDSYFGDPTDAIGGNIVGHASSYRLYIKKSKDDKRIVRMVDAPGLPDGEAIMRVTPDGLKGE